MSALRHLLSILALPTTVTIVVPYFVLRPHFRATLSAAVGSPLGVTALIGGLLVISCGLTLAGGTIRRFATEGHGTLAPWDPPRRLVVSGVYRHVRNPMISGVLLVLLGEALALRSTGLLLWALEFFVINAIYLPLIEEPGLERRFGEDYVEYRRHVPRWIPRLTPWEQPARPSS